MSGFKGCEFSNEQNIGIGHALSKRINEWLAFVAYPVVQPVLECRHNAKFVYNTREQGEQQQRKNAEIVEEELSCFRKYNHLLALAVIVVM